ncbi:MAG TPA: hypothetical protein VN937_02400 [Blastocatellia bacterium]|nr:hypothetical protein [Blastocatellia bacterium]
MKLKPAYTRISFDARRACRFVLIPCVLLAAAIISLSQIQLPEPPLPIDPRPIGQLLSASEKASLAEAQGHGAKKEVEIYLKLSDAHLQAAFNAISNNNHDAAERELDIYNKAVAEAGKETFALKDGRRTLSKKIEQTLYRQIKTLESIDRLFPSERAGFSDAALKHAKQLRVQALNEAFAAGGVLKDSDEETKPKTEPPAKEDPPKKRPAFPLHFTLRTIAVADNIGIQYALAPDRDRDRSAETRMLEPSSLQIAGDYLTEEEDDHVREAQAAEARVKVFMKIADRRIKAITGGTAGAPATLPDKSDKHEKKDKKIEDEEREWGALPKASRAELLRHYARAIAECMAKLEDAYERNPKSASLPKALTLLRDATERQLQVLRALSPETKNEKEVSALRDAIEEAETANKGARDGLSKH